MTEVGWDQATIDQFGSIGLRGPDGLPKLAWPTVVSFLGGQTGDLPVPVQCTYTVSPTSHNFSGAAGTFDVTISTTQTTCAWTAFDVGNPAWLSQTASGTGSGTITLTVTANTGTEGRSATVQVMDKTITVTQDGTTLPPPDPVVCTYTLAASSDTFTAALGNDTVALTTNDASCTWNVTVLDGGSDWLGVTAASGTGNATLTYTVTANTLAAARQARFSVNGTIFTVTQAGAETVPDPPDAQVIVPCTDTTTNSPTGTNPKMNWTRCRQATWNHKYADYLANTTNPATLGGQTMKFIKTSADSANLYGDLGQADAFMYQVTGDATYCSSGTIGQTGARGFYQALMGVFRDSDALNSSDKANVWRENAIHTVRNLEWCSPALTANQILDIQKELAQWIAWGYQLDFSPGSIGGVVAVSPTLLRIGDSDQTVGIYFAAVAAHLLWPTYAPFTTIYTHPVTGGLNLSMDLADYRGDLEAGDGGTMRNAVGYYMYMAEGGDYIEGTSYNWGSGNLLIGGYDAIRTITGVDYFPEVTAWLPKHAEAIIAGYTPDLEQMFQYGDDADAAILYPTFIPHRTDAIAQMRSYAGVMHGTTVGRRLQSLILDFVARYGEVGSRPLGGFNGPTSLVLHDPYDVATDWRTTKFHNSKNGIGMVSSRDGFGVNDGVFFYLGDNRRVNNTGVGASVDHDRLASGSWALYDESEWAIHNPLSSGGATWHGDGNNKVLYNGMGGVIEFTETTAVEQTDAYTYASTTTGGALDYVPPGGSSTSELYLNEGTRSIVYIPGATQVVITHDRGNVIHPDPYRDSIYGTIHDYFWRGNMFPDGDWAEVRRSESGIPKTDASQRMLFVQHARKQPTKTGSRWDWLTDANRPVRMNMLYPTDVNSAAANQTTYTLYHLFTSGGLTDQRKWDIKLWPNTSQQFNTFLNVVQIGTPYTVNAITDPGKVEGAHIVRTGLADVVLAFNAEAAPDLNPTLYHASHQGALRSARLRQTGYTLTWTAVGSSSTVYLQDLDPGVTWTLNIDGGGANAITPNSTTAPGHYSFSVASAGAHTIVIASTGVVEGGSCSSVTLAFALTSPLTAGTVGSAYSQNVTVTGGNDPYTYAKTFGTLPPSLTIASNGTLSGTPTVSGSYTFTVKAIDDDDCSDSKTYTLVIDPAPVSNNIQRTGTAGIFSNVSGSATTMTASYTMGAGGSNRMLLCGFTGGTSDTLTTATYNAVGMTLVNKVRVPGDLYHYLYRLVNPTTGANNVVVTFSAATAMVGMCQGYSGVNQTTPINASAVFCSAQPTTSCTSPTLLASSAIHAEVTATLDNTWTILSGRSWTGASASVGSNLLINSPGLGSWMFDYGPHVAGGIKSMDATFGSATRWGAVIAAINPVP
jgi:hypothetical protein